jgi:hypothetical protein
MDPPTVYITLSLMTTATSEEWLSVLTKTHEDYLLSLGDYLKDIWLLSTPDLQWSVTSSTFSATIEGICNPHSKLLAFFNQARVVIEVINTRFAWPTALLEPSLFAEMAASYVAAIPTLHHEDLMLRLRSPDRRLVDLHTFSASVPGVISEIQSYSWLNGKPEIRLDILVEMTTANLILNETPGKTPSTLCDGPFANSGVPTGESTRSILD